MVRLTKRYLRDYLEQRNLESADNLSARTVYEDFEFWVKKTTDITTKKLSDYLNGEMDWLIDFCRTKKRSHGRISDSDRRIERDSRELLYEILKDFDLKRKRSLN
jgi:hypothetical protein